METFPLEFFDLISNFDFLLFCPNLCPINFTPVLFFPLNLKVLKGETTIVPERRVTLNINDKLQFLNESNTTISPDKLKIKVIQGIFKQNFFHRRTFKK
jgi:hypothetical protein